MTLSNKWWVATDRSNAINDATLWRMVADDVCRVVSFTADLSITIAWQPYDTHDSTFETYYLDLDWRGSR